MSQWLQSMHHTHQKARVSQMLQSRLNRSIWSRSRVTVEKRRVAQNGSQVGSKRRPKTYKLELIDSLYNSTEYRLALGH